MEKRLYQTQMEAAKKGIATPEMHRVAKSENVDLGWLVGKVAEGKVVIPANINHVNLTPYGVGEGLSTKINVNLGVSKDEHNYEAEMEKVKKAL